MKKNKNNRVEGTVKIINWCTQTKEKEYNFSITTDRIPDADDMSADDYIASLAKTRATDMVEVNITKWPGKEKYGELADGKEFQFAFPSGNKKSFFLRVYWCGHEQEKLIFSWGKGGTIKNKPLEIIKEWKAVLPFVQKIIDKIEEDINLDIPFAATTYVAQAASYEIYKKCGVTLTPSKLEKLFEEAKGNIPL